MQRKHREWATGSFKQRHDYVALDARNTPAYSDIPFYNGQGSQRLGLPQLGDELVALDEAGEPALGAGREPAHPLATDEDVRQRAPQLVHSVEPWPYSLWSSTRVAEPLGPSANHSSPSGTFSNLQPVLSSTARASVEKGERPYV